MSGNYISKHNRKLVMSSHTLNRRGFIENLATSTAGFNQVIVAARAFVEHGIGLNVVAEHGSVDDQSATMEGRTDTSNEQRANHS